MEKKTRQLVIWSFAGVIILCIVVFAWLATFMTGKTRESVTDIGIIYISEINEQIQQKFQTIVSLRLEQVDILMQSSLPDSEEYEETLFDNLMEGAALTSFTYLGFYKEDGTLETIYGNEIVFEGEDDVEDLLGSYGSVIKRGIDSNGDMLFLFGRAAEYELEDGSKSIALLAGIPMEDMNDALYLYTEGANAYSHIIDMDGDYVIRNADFENDNYFERIEQEFETLDGKTSEDYKAELHAAMENGEDYGTTISVDGEERYIYCTPIATKATWYLITVMPEGVIKETMTDLDQLRITVIFGAMLIILTSMMVVFFLYVWMTRRNLRDLEAAREEAIHANHAKSDFLSSMSHDIRTPMNAIMGMTDIALDNRQNPAKVEDCLEKIRLSGRHLLGLINDVLDMSKIESGKMSINWGHVSLRESMDDIVNIVQPQIKAKNQVFDIFIRDIIAENLICDGTRLNQILLNLLSNAMKFTPTEGRIDVQIWQEEIPEEAELVRTHFVVEDTGIGMSKEFQSSLFDTFTREKSDEVEKTEGTGLGMAITKAIVNAFGGTIELTSEQGKGSRFHVMLDFQKAGDEADMQLPPWHVLLVDDSEQLCTGAASCLNEMGVQAEWTVDGKEALRKIEVRHEKEEDYQFVLIDWKMPGMDGIRTIHEIRSRIGRDIPIFLISAYDWTDIEEEPVLEEIDGFIAKPLFKSTLYETLNRYVHGTERMRVEKEAGRTDFTGKRVLLAEDIEINREVADEILKTFGITSEYAGNGQECVELFEKSAPGYYDAVFMDLQMPVMNGFEATKAIRASEREDRGLPIIAMTANAFSSDIQECLDCGMDAHLAKPLDRKAILAALQKYL